MPIGLQTYDSKLNMANFVNFFLEYLVKIINISIVSIFSLLGIGSGYGLPSVAFINKIVTAL